jgi:ATP-dependent Clp protease protease subunit
MSITGLKNTDSTQIEEDTLEARGIHLLMDEIHELSIKPVIEWILKENLKSKRAKKLTLIVSSFGGSVSDAFALIDVMRGSAIPIHTIGLGAVGSSGFLIFITGKKGERILTPNTSILSHQYSWGDYGKHHELVGSRVEQDLTHERFINHYKKCLGLSKKDIEEKLLKETDVWLTAKEALELGICDKVKDL